MTDTPSNPASPPKKRTAMGTFKKYLLIFLGLYVVIVTMHYKHFDWEILRIHSDQKYINPALPFLEDIVGNELLPKTVQKKQNFDYRVYVSKYSTYEGFNFPGGTDYTIYVPKMFDPDCKKNVQQINA